MKEIAVFFDFDGTLADSRADLASAVNDTRKDLGLNLISLEEVLAHVGHGAKHLLAHSIPEVAFTDELWQKFSKHYGNHMVDKAVLYPTVRETLEILKNAGFKLGINTAKPPFALRALLDHFGIKELFKDAIVAGGDCDEMKPSAKPLLMCAQKMGHVLTSDDWMVGDHWTDLKCAANAGVKSAFCAFGFGRLEDATYDARLEKMSDLLQFVK